MCYIVSKDGEELLLDKVSNDDNGSEWEVKMLMVEVHEKFFLAEREWDSMCKVCSYIVAFHCWKNSVVICDELQTRLGYGNMVS